jgi:hypothetical protein
MTIKFPQKGIHDNKPTPKDLYQLITEELKFTDVCLDRTKFNAVVKLWPNRSYCNPPFSNKKPFILRAIASNRINHSEVLLYLPFDSTVSWFRALYDSNVLIMVFTKRLMHAKFPHALFHLKNYTHTSSSRKR